MTAGGNRGYDARVAHPARVYDYWLGGPAEMAEMIKRMNEHLAEGNHVGRPRDMVERFFAGVDLAEPGVVKVTDWRPVSALEAGGPTSLWGGAGRKP